MLLDEALLPDDELLGDEFADDELLDDELLDDELADDGLLDDELADGLLKELLLFDRTGLVDVVAGLAVLDEALAGVLLDEEPLALPLALAPFGFVILPAFTLPVVPLELALAAFGGELVVGLASVGL